MEVSLGGTVQRWAQAVLRSVSACLSEVAAGCPTMDAGLRLVHAAGVPCSAEEAGEGPLGGAQPAAATAARQVAAIKENAGWQCACLCLASNKPCHLQLLQQSTRDG